jgi:hypothetical protein
MERERPRRRLARLVARLPRLLLAWLVYGIRKRDATIWIVCIGWIVVDGAIVIGILVRG